MDAAALRALCEHALTPAVRNRAANDAENAFLAGEPSSLPAWRAPIVDALVSALTSVLQAGRTEPPPQDGFYRVSVDDRAGNIVTIEPRMLAGRDIGNSEDAAIRSAIEALSGFIGQPRSLEGDRPPEARTPTWQPIASAPKDGRLVLLYPSGVWVEDAEGTDCEVGYWEGEIEAWVSIGRRADDFTGHTHWHPLPDAPTPAPEEPQR